MSVPSGSTMPWPRTPPCLRRAGHCSYRWSTYSPSQNGASRSLTSGRPAFADPTADGALAVPLRPLGAVLAVVETQHTVPDAHPDRLPVVPLGEVLDELGVEVVAEVVGQVGKADVDD